MKLEQLNQLLAVGVQNGASDIHFKVGSPPAYRVAGTLHYLKSQPLMPPDTHTICETLITDPQIRSDLARVHEHDTSYSVPGVARFRVNVFRQRGSLAAILRIIPREIPTVASLNLPPVVSRLADAERGLVLVTGATGSGKSSTLAALVNHINHTRQVHVLTIEDPIEFLHQDRKASISQREVGLDTPNYRVALRAALRQDPDVILVGEMRDAETIDIALKAAETGHMVFSTVHTTDAAKTIGRLISVFPAAEQEQVRMRIADNLFGTVSQRLLRRADGNGRVAACEVMFATSTIKQCIQTAEKTSSIIDTIENGRDQYGMQSFDQHLLDLFHAETITLDTARAAATRPSDFMRAVNFQ